MMVVVPAYNEVKVIGRVVRDLLQHGYSDVVVVDDGSSDGTGEAARTSGATIIRHAVNRGQGAALQTGDEYAISLGAEGVIHFDGDGQFNAADIAGAVEKMKRDNLDVVLGSRFLDSRSRVPWFKRYCVLPVARVINYFITGVKLTDAHNGFRILGPRALNIVTIRHSGMAHNSEIVAQMKKYQLKFAEYPVAVVYNHYGQGVIGGLKIIIDIIAHKIIK